jgi:sulfate permease, SulP family
LTGWATTGGPGCAATLSPTLTTWALVVPQAIAYAQIAQLPPQAGLFAAFGGLLGYGLFGSSRQLIVSPTSATAAISAALVAPVALGDPARFRDLSAALAILVGIVLVVLGVLHVGFVSRFISAAVQAGFMFGLGLTIIVGQVPALLGVSKGGGDFFPQLWHLVTHSGDANGWTAAIGLAGLALLLGLKRAAPNVPAALLVVVAGIVVVALGGLADHGVAVIGRIEGAVPTPALPDVLARS